jgi:hypothetical protein
MSAASRVFAGSKREAATREIIARIYVLTNEVLGELLEELLNALERSLPQK